MNPASIHTGDIFYYDTLTSHDGKTHRHKCRVLFVGTESIFYDSWSDALNKWTFVPVKKRLAYYRFPLTMLPKLINLYFNGSEAIDAKSAKKLYLNSPEILFSSTKEIISANKYDKTPVEANSDAIAFIPTGPNGGALKPVLLESDGLTQDGLIKFLLEHQNLAFIENPKIVLHRVGLHNGVPSYSIRIQ
jgi:hypothetical protein